MGKLGDIAMVGAIGVGAFVLLKTFGGIGQFFGGISDFFSGIFGKDRTLAEQIEEATERVEAATERIGGIAETGESIAEKIKAHFAPTVPTYPTEPEYPVYVAPKVYEAYKTYDIDVPPYVQPLPTPTPEQIAAGMMGTWHLSELNPMAPPSFRIDWSA